MFFSFTGSLHPFHQPKLSFPVKSFKKIFPTYMPTNPPSQKSAIAFRAFHQAIIAFPENFWPAGSETRPWPVTIIQSKLSPHLSDTSGHPKHFCTTLDPNQATPWSLVGGGLGGSRVTKSLANLVAFEPSMDTNIFINHIPKDSMQNVNSKAPLSCCSNSCGSFPG